MEATEQAGDLWIVGIAVVAGVAVVLTGLVIWVAIRFYRALFSEDEDPDDGGFDFGMSSES